MNSILNPFIDELHYYNTTLEFMTSIEEYIDADTMKMLLYSERIITFRVPWLHDNGKLEVNYGYRVQHSSALGPYKGGIRFHPSVNLDILKFLAFEQTMKNALTGLPLGGAKGGADFDPHGKSDHEIMRFCQSYMNELYKYIGATTDIPAGDIGVGNREIGYMFGQYKKLMNVFEGVFTGKELHLAGLDGRMQATGFGLIYITERLLNTYDDTIQNKRVIVSGSGKVGLYAALKAQQMGAIIVAMNDSSGTIVDENGIDVDRLIQYKMIEGKSIRDYCLASTQSLGNVKDIWNIPCDIALPCATQNELDQDDLEKLTKNGCKVIAEGANKPLTQDAVKAVLETDILYLPGKAANAGGVLTSGIEMMQNAQMDVFNFEYVDKRLKEMMEDLFDAIQTKAIEINDSKNYLKASNLLAYEKLSKAIKSQGIV